MGQGRGWLPSVLSARYVRLETLSKRAPKGAPVFPTPPACPTYGVRPRGSTVVIDIDVDNNGLSLQQQHKLLSELLGVDTLSSLRVSTPSGGEHVYLDFGRSVASIKKDFGVFPTSLRGKGVGVNADIRSSAERWGYVVGPGSFVGIGEYVIANRVPPAVVPESGVRKFVRAFTGKKRLPSDVASAVQSASSSFHVKRARVYALAGCCSSPRDMVKLWKELGIDQDTHTGKSIKTAHLYKDLKRMKEKYPFQGHGKYCPLFDKESAYSRARNFFAGAEEVPADVGEQTTQRAVSFVQEYGRCNPNARVINARQVYRRLSPKLRVSDGSPIVTQELRDAYKILFSYFEPLANAGAPKSPAPYGLLERELGLSRSRIRRALTLLRSRGILSVVNRQRQGRSAVYAINPKLTSRGWTKTLRSLYGAYSVRVRGVTGHEIAAFDHLTEMFVSVNTGEVLHQAKPCRTGSAPLSELPGLRELLAGTFRTDIAANYRRDDIQRHRELVQFCAFDKRPSVMRIHDKAIRQQQFDFFDRGEHHKDAALGPVSVNVPSAVHSMSFNRLPAGASHRGYRIELLRVVSRRLMNCYKTSVDSQAVIKNLHDRISFCAVSRLVHVDCAVFGRSPPDCLRFAEHSVHRRRVASHAVSL